MSTGRTGVPGSTQETEIIEETEIVEDVSTETTKDETVAETVQRALKELEGSGDGGEGAEEASAEAEPTAADPLKGKPAPAAPGQPFSEQPAEVDPDLLPPERLDAKAKKLFQNLPKGLKKEFHRTIKDLEAGATRKVQELAGAQREAQAAAAESRAIVEAVLPYARQWGEQGLSVSAAVAELAAAHANLTDPRTKEQTFLKLARNCGIDLDRLVSGQVQQPAEAMDLQSNPVVSELRAELDRLKSQVTERDIAPAVAEMQSVQREVDPASGRPVYPELQDEVFLNAVKPRVLELVRNEPALGYGDALRKAVHEWRSRLGYPIPQSQTRLPAANKQQQFAQRAAVSVRGRSTPGLMAANSGDEPPPEALRSPAATAQWAMEKLRRGM